MTQVGELDFDSGEFGPDEPVEEQLNPTQTNNIMAMLVDKHLKPDSIVEAIDSMFEVDRRMDIATCYRIILKSPLFGTPSESSEIVENEVRAFVRSRLEVLVGMKADNKPVEVVKSPFTEQEVLTLKNLAKLSDKELNTLNLILAKVLGATKQEPTVSPVKTSPVKQVPVLVPRQTGPSEVATINTPTPAIAAPVEAPKRRGRPPTTITVTDPNTGEAIEMRAPKMRVVGNPNAAPMPSGTAMVIAQTIAAERSAAVQNNSPVAQEILGNLGVR